MSGQHGHILGFCGLYCGGCHIYQKTQRGGRVELEPGNFVSCGGCNSENTAPQCTDCAIKACAREKGFRYCLSCPDFPCDKMTAFMDDPCYPYHKDVPANMRRLKEIGLAAWCEEQEKHWRCPACGGQRHWFEKQCSHCGAEI